jgi:hypothetical protein
MTVPTRICRSKFYRRLYQIITASKIDDDIPFQIMVRHPHHIARMRQSFERKTFSAGIGVIAIRRNIKFMRHRRAQGKRAAPHGQQQEQGKLPGHHRILAEPPPEAITERQCLYVGQAGKPALLLTFSDFISPP